MDNNNIEFIDQRIAHLRTIIPQCREQSAAADKRLADTIITLEIKRIVDIHALEKRLTELRALIPIYKARCHLFKHVLVKQTINFDFQLIAASQPPSLHHSAPHPPALHSPKLNFFCTAALRINRYGRNSY